MVAIILVPSRGHLYLNGFEETFCKEEKKILVPSRGHLYLNKEERKAKRKGKKFSSPLGAIYISILSPAPPVNTGLKLRFAAQTEMGCPVPPFCSPQPSFSRYLQSAAENQVLRSFIP